MRNSYLLIELNVHVRVFRNAVLIRLALAMLRLSFVHRCIRNLWRNQIYFACYHLHARDLMNIALTRNVNNPFRVTIVAERMNVCKLSSGVLRRAKCTYNRNDKSGKPREIMLSSDKQGVSRSRSHPSARVARPFSIGFTSTYIARIISQHPSEFFFTSVISFGMHRRWDRQRITVW